MPFWSRSTTRWSPAVRLINVSTAVRTARLYSMRAYWYMEQDDLTLGAKNAQFLKLFHAEDQGVVEDWISRCHAEEPYTAPRRDRKSALLYAVLERARACGDLREIEPIWTTTFQPSRSRWLRIWTAI